MKFNKTPTAFQKAYALRRLIYNMLLAAEAIQYLKGAKGAYATAEIHKCSAVMMARNLDEFLYGTGYKFDDDIHASDFDIQNWRPNGSAKLSSDIKRRISKSSGHVVADKTMPFKNTKEIFDIVVPLLSEASVFVAKSLSGKRAKYRGKAKEYANELNKRLTLLDVALVPDE